MAEEFDILRLAFVEDAEVLLHEVGNKAALIVGDGDGDDDFGGGSPELNAARVGLRRGGRGGGLLRRGGRGRRRGGGLLGHRGQAENQTAKRTGSENA